MYRQQRDATATPTALVLRASYFLDALSFEDAVRPFLRSPIVMIHMDSMRTGVQGGIHFWDPHPCGGLAASLAVL